MNNLPNTQTTLDDFIKEKVIGKGSFGSVYLVRRKQDQKLYALKTVFLEKLNKKEQENSVNEVRLLASINHPNVIGYKEAFWNDKNCSLNIIMEYADDGDLQKKIIKKREEGKNFNENLIWLYSIQMIEGLKALHDKKIMHRDLKSANIFLTKKIHQCKIGDMNVSKVIKDKVLTTQTGTPYYASPEVWRDEPYSYKSDLWSIGCVIYEMCSLRPPFNGKDMNDLFEKVCSGKLKRIDNFYSEDLWNMILMLIQTDVDKRVDCDKFLNSELIKKKIKEFKSIPNTYYDGCKLEQNMNKDTSNISLLETINFKSINELKYQLPNIKNYESNKTIANSILNSNYKKDNANSRFINNIYINQSLNSNSNYVPTHKGKKSFKKNIALENTNINNTITNIVNNTESQNHSKSNQNNNCYEYNNKKQNLDKVKNKNNIIKKLLKNISFQKPNKSKNHKVGISDKNSSEKNILTKKDKKIKDYKYIEKKKIKEFRKIIEYKKIKELLKINKKNERSSTNKTDRRKNKSKKSCCNLFSINKTEQGVKKIKNKINYELEDSIKNIKNNSLLGNLNKSNIIKRINTEQKFSLEKKINKLEFEKKFKKKIIKSHTSVSLINKIKNREKAYLLGINIASLDSNNNKLILKLNKINNIYSSFIYNFNNNKKKFIKKNDLNTITPIFSNNKKKRKNTSKRNSTNVLNIIESFNYIKTIKNSNKKNKRMNDIYNTVNFNNNIEHNMFFNSINQKNLVKKNTEIDKLYKSLKIKKIKSKSKVTKPNTHISIKKKRFINYEFNDDNSNNIFINNSQTNRKNKINKNKLIDIKNYTSIIKKNRNNEKSQNISNRSNDNKTINFLKIQKHKKNSPRVDESYNFILLPLKQKTIQSSKGCSLNNIKIDTIQKRNSYIYYFSKINKKNKKTNNINLKKVNIPSLYIKNNNSVNNNNNFLRYKKNYNRNKDFIDLEKFVYEKQRKNIKYKNSKKSLNFTENENYILSNPNIFLQNVKPIYLNIKNSNTSLVLGGTSSNNRVSNRRINTTSANYDAKNNKLFNSQIFNNYYSINNIDASSLPVKVINFY